MVEHELPKLDTRVRFPLPALPYSIRVPAVRLCKVTTPVTTWLIKSERFFGENLEAVASKVQFPSRCRRLKRNTFTTSLPLPASGNCNKCPENPKDSHNACLWYALSRPEPDARRCDGFLPVASIVSNDDPIPRRVEVCTIGPYFHQCRICARRGVFAHDEGPRSQIARKVENKMRPGVRTQHLTECQASDLNSIIEKISSTEVARQSGRCQNKETRHSVRWCKSRIK